jgi:minichromosome maintenance protein 10
MHSYPLTEKTRRPETTNATYALKTVNTIYVPVNKRQAEDFVPAKPAASTLLSKLANVNRRPLDTVEPEPLVRSSAFTDVPQAPDPVASGSTAPQRDERLAIIESLEVGTADHKPSFDDPLFQQLEPNSGIRLS